MAGTSPAMTESGSKIRFQRTRIQLSLVRAKADIQSQFEMPGILRWVPLSRGRADDGLIQLQ
jgi:hypothetical protein